MTDETKKCPMCAEQIPTDAVFCPYCGTRFGEEIQAAPSIAKPVLSRPVLAATPAAKKSHACLWIAGTTVLIILCGVIGILLWSQRLNLPGLSGLLATPTPIATPALPPTFTPTLPPTFTPTYVITEKPTETTVPSPTLDPTTGIVSGVIQWGDQPFEGVTVKLCTDWFYTCKGTELTAITNAQGGFTITGINPGDYQFIYQLPGENFETRILGNGALPVIIKVTAGKAVNLDPASVCKHDLVMVPPILQGGSVTFSWEPYPGASSYYASMLNLTGGSGAHAPGQTKSTSFAVVLSPGTYQLRVKAFSTGCSEGIINFTMP